MDERKFKSMAEVAGNSEHPKGLICKRCHGQQLRVDATRQVAEGVARYRVCRTCGYRWRTDEK